MLSSLIVLVIFAILASLILWVAQQFITDPMILKVIRVVVVVVCVITVVVFLADVFGVDTGLHLRLRS